MFHSAILKLTGWYLLILMSISFLFSVTIYNAATSEVSDRIDAMRQQFGPMSNYPQNKFMLFQNAQREAANRNFFITLLYVNILILLGGGALSYLLARRTLKQIEEAHNAQARFTSDASHELRTPLAAMRAELEVALRDQKISKQDMKELLESNLEEVNKLTALSKTLLQLSKLDYANLELSDVDLTMTVSDVVQRYDKNASRVVLNLPSKPIILRANQPSVEELITILVDNALKYSPEKSKITVELSRKGRQAQFAITNSGKGIAAEDLPHIFDRFYRAEQSRTTSGTGLGLSLAKKIVAMHGGELSVSSAKDHDTTFRFLLPILRKTKA